MWRRDLSADHVLALIIKKSKIDGEAVKSLAALNQGHLICGGACSKQGLRSEL